MHRRHKRIDHGVCRSNQVGGCVVVTSIKRAQRIAKGGKSRRNCCTGGRFQRPEGIIQRDKQLHHSRIIGKRRSGSVERGGQISLVHTVIGSVQRGENGICLGFEIVGEPRRSSSAYRQCGQRIVERLKFDNCGVAANIQRLFRRIQRQHTRQNTSLSVGGLEVGGIFLTHHLAINDLIHFSNFDYWHTSRLGTDSICGSVESLESSYSITIGCKPEGPG